MKRPLLITGCILLFTAAGCNQSLSDAGKKKIAADIKQMMNSYCNDVKQHGLTAEFRYLDSSADFYWIPPGYTAPIGYDSVAAILRRNAPTLSIVDNRYEQLRIIPLSTEIASYTAQVISSATDIKGNIHTAKLLESGTVIKRKEGWKLVCGQTELLQ